MPYRLTLSASGTIRPQRSKDFSMAINGLMTRRSFIVTEAPETLTSDLAAIDRSLQLLGFTEDPNSYMPRQRNKRVFAKGEMLRLITGVMREATEPLSSREICITILSAKGFDMSDKRRVNQATSRVYKKLCIEADAGRVKRVDEWPARWAEPQHIKALRPRFI